MNPRLIGFLFYLLIVHMLDAQTPIALDIYSARNHQTPTHVDIFQTNTTNLVQFEDSGLVDYSTFKVDQAALKLIQSTDHSTIAFDLSLKEKDYELELKSVDFLHPEFKVIDAQGHRIEVPIGKFYRGIVNGHPDSYAAISIFKDEVVGVFSTPTEGNFVIGKLDNVEGEHILYNDGDLTIKNDFECGTLEDMQVESSFVSQPSALTAAECKKVNIYIEVDNIMYNDFNRNQTSITNYVTGLFNVAGVLYENEDVLIGIKTIKIWTTPDGYRKNNSRALLDDFSDAIKNDIDGDIGHCLTTTPGSLGGIAWVDVLCSSYNPIQHYNRTAISDIGTSYRQYPQYSWSAMVITHEMGHNLGSPHTHSCSWGPQGNQALDNCASTQGGCAPGPTPNGGGTIMSYCHLTSHGINFTKGFGQEPGDLIRSRIQNAGCLGRAFEATAEVEGEMEFYEGDSTTLKAKPFGVQYTYQWFRNGGAISGAVNPTLTVKQSGTYHCEVSTSCYEITNSVDVTVNKFYVSLHCPIQDAEEGTATLKLDTFYVDATESEYYYDVPQSIRDQVPTTDVAETSIEMEVCMGNYFPSRLADLNLSVSGPPMSNLTNREIRNHKTVLFGDRCYVVPLGDFDPTGEWIFLASDNNNDIPTGPESYVSVEIRQNWILDPKPSDCDLYICEGDTSILDAGVSGLTYKWSTGDTTQQISVTQAGTYSVTVSNGPIERSDEINVFILPSNYQVDTTICEGDVFVLGDQDITEAGMYIDTLVSSKGCDSILSVNLMTQEVPKLEEDLLVCYGDTYNDVIMTKDTVIETRFNLMEGCDSFYILNVTVNPEILINLEAQAGCEDVGAHVKANVSGGSSDYDYLWDNGAVGAEISGIASGPITCQVTDAANCTVMDVITIQNFDSIATSTIETMVACFGDSTGSIDITVLEGTSPFDFTWSNGASTEDLTNIAAGSYEVMIVDSNDCEENLTFDIDQNDEIEANPKVTGPNKGQNNGIIELFPFGGAGKYTYLWEDGSTNSERTDLALGTYEVTVTDSLGCSRDFEIEVTVNTSVFEIEGVVQFQMFPNPVRDQLMVQLELDKPKEIKLELIDVYGRTASKWQVQPSFQIDHIIDVSNLQDGVYLLKLTVDHQSGVVQVIKQ